MLREIVFQFLAYKAFTNVVINQIGRSTRSEVGIDPMGSQTVPSVLGRYILKLSGCLETSYLVNNVYNRLGVNIYNNE
jgi:hypothetical protein